MNHDSLRWLQRSRKEKILKYLLIFLVFVSFLVPVTCAQGAEPTEDSIMEEIQCAIDPVCHRDRVRDLRQEARKARTFHAWMSVYREAGKLGKTHIQNKALRGMK